jgi:hypothetical protein
MPFLYASGHEARQARAHSLPLPSAVIVIQGKQCCAVRAPQIQQQLSRAEPVSYGLRQFIEYVFSHVDRCDSEELSRPHLPLFALVSLGQCSPLRASRRAIE